jgi:protein-arginine deiminase
MKRTIVLMNTLFMLAMTACAGAPDSSADLSRPGADGAGLDVSERSDQEANPGDLVSDGAADIGTVNDLVGELATVDGTEVIEPAAVLNLATDADRNGKVSFTDPDDEELEENWSMKSGAVFLLNLDDDDGDGLADALDSQVNGPEDALDLAPIYLAPAPWLPGDATLELTAKNGELGRLFRFVQGTWVPLVLPLSMESAELQDEPMVLGFEGRATALLMSPEKSERVVQLTLTARAFDGTLLGEDFAVLHHAPLLVTSTLLPVKEVWSRGGGDSVPASVLSGLFDLLAVAGISLTVLDGDGEDLSLLSERMEVVLAVRPDGKGHSVVYYPLLTAPSPSALASLEAALLGADIAPLLAPGGVNEDLSLVSLGNIESSPVLLAGEMFLPYGRLYYGFDGESQLGPPAPVLELLARQGLQGEPVAVDTSFLHFGQLSQVLSWVPYSGDPGCCGKGFRMLFADPTLALTLVEQWVANGQGEATLETPDGPISLSSLTGDSGLRAFNEATASELEVLYGAFLPEFGLVDDDVIRVPLLFFPHPQSGRAVPLLPAITDAFVVGKHYLAPATESGGEGFDLMAAWLEEALAPINAVVTFVPLPYSPSSIAETGSFGCLRQLLVGRRKPDNVEWWLWFM